MKLHEGGELRVIKENPKGNESEVGEGGHLWGRNASRGLQSECGFGPSVAGSNLDMRKSPCVDLEADRSPSFLKN